MKILVHIKDRHGDDLVPWGKYEVVDAINAMHGAIKTLRQGTQSGLDPSWGLESSAILAPSEEELPPKEHSIFWSASPRFVNGKRTNLVLLAGSSEWLDLGDLQVYECEDHTWRVFFQNGYITHEMDEKLRNLPDRETAIKKAEEWWNEWLAITTADLADRSAA